MSRAVFDIEADGLYPTKIHCLSYYDSVEKKTVSTTDYNEMKKFFKRTKTLIGHNIVRYDIPVVERILSIRVESKLIDTLSLSWYLYPEVKKHGLEYWGEYFNVPKPSIDDWENLTEEEYIHRCEEDVEINRLLWKKEWDHLCLIYDKESQAKKLISYLTFKMDCAREQERSKWKLDRSKTEEGLASLEKERLEKVEALTKAMPKVPIYRDKSKPAKPYKKDGTYSVSGAQWFSLLKKNNLPENYEGTVSVLIREDEGNPNSTIQIKNWLFSLGWKPETFKIVKDKDSDSTRKIPQINLEHGGGICPSIRKLYDVEPNLELLDGLSVINHRISILRGFLDSMDSEENVKAEVNGFTNTLRFKHKVVVNLPGVSKPYGELIRGCLIAPEGYVLCGSDMSGLEDRLKQHYIYPYDPDYVNEMLSDDYDPHLSLALLANKVTQEQVDRYKSGEDKSISPIRHTFKQGNYACQYGAGVPRLALTANISKKEAEEVHTAYWKKNWAIKRVADDQTIRIVKGQMWLLNPINGFWYSLRYEKDIFSTLVQGSAAYVFDLWVKNIRKKRSQLTAQFHDEIILCIREGFRDKCTNLINKAIDETNKQLNLNRILAVDIQFGNNYASIH